MEEIARIAKAYYDRLPEEKKQTANEIFRSLDIDGDGKITYYEYISNFRARGTEPDPKFFELIDKDKNGALDFNEFLCWHYLASTNRLCICDGCGVFLTGLYFICSLCFHTHKTYDLCYSCYKSNHVIMSHRHPPDAFLDNFALLHINRSKVLEIQHQHQVINHHHHHSQHHLQQNNVGVAEMIQAFSLGANLADSCGIL